MVLWLKGLALGFGAGVVTIAIASFVSPRVSNEARASEKSSVPVRAAPAANGEAAVAPGRPTVASVHGLVPQERAPLPEQAFLDSPPSREALPAEPVHSRRAGELAAINAVRAALVAKNPQAALAQLSRYELDYPEAWFGLPAQLLRIEALAMSGRPQAARELASAFVAAHPDSLHAARLSAFAAGE
jgi:hypothetical protein